MKFTLLFLLCALSWSANAQQKRRPVAVLEFISSGKLEKSEVITLTKRFRDMLVQTNVFIVLERDKMDAILKEQDFILSDNCNSAECAVQVGQLLGVEAVVTGDIGKVGDTWTVSLRMVDMTTGRIEKTETMDYRGTIDGMLDVMRQIAFVFAGKEPPKGKTTLIISGEEGARQPFRQGRWTIHAMWLPSVPVQKNSVFDNSSWNDYTTKKIINKTGTEFAVAYMATSKLSIGLSFKMWTYQYTDTLTYGPGLSDFFEMNIADFKAYAVGPRISYHLTTSRFSPFADISLRYFRMVPTMKEPRVSIVGSDYTRKAIQKNKDVRSESGLSGELTVGVDVHAFSFMDIRLAPSVMRLNAKPLSGSLHLNTGLIFHFGKSFPQ